VAHFPPRLRGHSRTLAQARLVTVLDLMDEDAGQVFSHDVLSCVFCDQPVDDEQFRL
jgi:hypothetical protein